MSLGKGAQRAAAVAPASRFGGGLKLENVLEEEEGSEDDHSETEDGIGLMENMEQVKLEDFPQAFSHFSYIYTNQEKLVCDLQGVLDKSVWPPMFELTDPVIHYSSSVGRTKVYGRTDYGKKGIAAFFSSHKCNALCQALGLSEHV